MKKILIISLFYTLNTYAGFWCPDKPNEIRYPKPHSGCFEVDDAFDVETVKVKNGKLEIDQDKVTAKAQKQADKAAAQAEKAAKISACEALYDNVNQVSTNAEIKAILKCLVKDAK
jgi:hypothetical protein